MPDIISIAAALIFDPKGRTLLVRKAGTTAFQQPGGKIDAGESPRQALLRELEEEIGLTLPPARLRAFGQFSAPAANEPGHTVAAEIFVIEGVEPSEMRIGAEIAEALWLDPGATGGVVLAPLTGDVLLPKWRATRRVEDAR